MRRRPRPGGGAVTGMPPPATGALTDTIKAVLACPLVAHACEAKDDLDTVIQGLTPDTAPDALLVDLVLIWAAVSAGDPQHATWTAWAVAASLHLHGPGHPQVRRAQLGVAAIRTGILGPGRLGHDSPATTATRVARAVAALLVDTRYEPHDGHSFLGDHLTAYRGLHARGACDTAITELGRTLRAFQVRCPTDSPGLSAIVLVLIAMLTACGHDTAADRVLRQHPGILAAPGSLSRDLLAECALTVLDEFNAEHPPVCTSRHRHNDPPPTPVPSRWSLWTRRLRPHPQSPSSTGPGHAPAGSRMSRPPYDRHAWSALLVGEDPRHHLAAAPRPRIGTAATRLPVDLDDLLERLDTDAFRAGHEHSTCTTLPSTTGLYLVCDTCRLMLCLGATAVQAAAPRVLAEPVTHDGLPAWQDHTLVRAMWRMLGEHTGHDLRSITGHPQQHRRYEVAPTTVIGVSGLGPSAVTHAQYADGWPDAPATAYPGTTPRPAQAADGDAVVLVCLTCGLLLDLDQVAGDPGAETSPAITIAGRCAAEVATATTAVFRMTVDHVGHDLLLAAGEDGIQGVRDLDTWITVILPDACHPNDPGDITHGQYVDGWPRHPTRPRYLGTDPARRRPLFHLRQTCGHAMNPPRRHPQPPNSSPLPPAARSNPSAYPSVHRGGHRHECPGGAHPGPAHHHGNRPGHAGDGRGVRPRSTRKQPPPTDGPQRPSPRRDEPVRHHGTTTPKQRALLTVGGAAPRMSGPGNRAPSSWQLPSVTPPWTETAGESPGTVAAGRTRSKAAPITAEDPRLPRRDTAPPVPDSAKRRTDRPALRPSPDDPTSDVDIRRRATVPEPPAHPPKAGIRQDRADGRGPR